MLVTINTNMKKFTTKQFVERSISVHGDVYDYSKSEYVSLRKPITIICKKHGEFTQLPSNHFKGSGCLRCSRERLSMPIAEFITRANVIHNNTYSYENAILSGMNNKITITCPIHGDFQQRAASHLEGSGCQQCNKPEVTTESFIQEVIVRHGQRHYNYDKVQYVKANQKIEIVCDYHGPFFQRPSDHQYGYGCPKCGGGQKVTTEDFIERSSKKHDNYYKYGKVQLDGMDKKVTITCPIHGDFEQRPADHVNGIGCLVCSKAKQGQYGELFFENNAAMKNTPAMLYLIVVDDTFCKIGITTHKVLRRRFPSLNFQKVISLQLPLYEAFTKEQEILEKFKLDRYKIHDMKKMKWQSGWTECFPLEMLPKLKREIF